VPEWSTDYCVGKGRPNGLDVLVEMLNGPSLGGLILLMKSDASAKAMRKKALCAQETQWLSAYGGSNQLFSFRKRENLGKEKTTFPAEKVLSPALSILLLSLFVCVSMGDEEDQPSYVRKKVHNTVELIPNIFAGVDLSKIAEEEEKNYFRAVEEAIKKKKE